VLVDVKLDLFAVAGDGADGRIFVFGHQPAVAGYVGREDRGESPFVGVRVQSMGLRSFPVRELYCTAASPPGRM
jgi:hypothetical protein